MRSEIREQPDTLFPPIAPQRPAAVTSLLDQKNLQLFIDGYGCKLLFGISPVAAAPASGLTFEWSLVLGLLLFLVHDRYVLFFQSKMSPRMIVGPIGASIRARGVIWKRLRKITHHGITSPRMWLSRCRPRRHRARRTRTVTGSTNDGDGGGGDPPAQTLNSSSIPNPAPRPARPGGGVLLFPPCSKSSSHE